MKIVCDCGNEMEFIPTKYKPLYEGDKPFIDEKSTQYVNYDKNKFGLVSYHGDEKIIECKNCNKGIWFY